MVTLDTRIAHEVINEIVEILDGLEWSADTCTAIAEVLREAGVTIRDTADEDSPSIYDENDEPDTDIAERMLP